MTWIDWTGIFSKKSMMVTEDNELHVIVDWAHPKLSERVRIKIKAFHSDNFRSDPHPSNKTIFGDCTCKGTQYVMSKGDSKNDVVLKEIDLLKRELELLKQVNAALKKKAAKKK